MRVEIHAANDDRLIVHGYLPVKPVKVTDEETGQTVLVEQSDELLTASGWQSALTNHYDEPRSDDATARPLSQAETEAYALRLLAEQNPQHPQFTPPAAELLHSFEA